MNRALVLQAPPAGAEQLMLLFHGVGARPQDMAPLGRELAAAFPKTHVVSVAAPDPSDLGSGHQWFSVRGVTEENRRERVDAALPRFVATVQQWQARLGLAAAATALIGFSQGAIMALAATRWAERIAGRVVSLSGRFDELPAAAPAGIRLHFIHGTADAVIAPACSLRAATLMQQLGGSATLDLVPGMAHTIGARAAELAVQRLRATA